MNAPNASFARELAAAMDWWRNAGVDLEFSDDVTAWLSDEKESETQSGDEASRTAPPTTSPNASPDLSEKPVAPVERLDLLGDSPPETLEAFHTFWLEAPGLDAIGPRGRIKPRGPANADLMVLVVDPEEGDRDSLLSGVQGQLLGRMLGAMGFSEEQAYIASALPRHTPMADTAAIAAGGMDAVLAHHISLAAPKRVLALGANILPLLGHDLSQKVTSLREINHGALTTPLMVSEGLDSMMSMPRLKARFWRRWMEWSSGQ